MKSSRSRSGSRGYGKSPSSSDSEDERVAYRRPVASGGGSASRNNSNNLYSLSKPHSSSSHYEAPSSTLRGRSMPPPSSYSNRTFDDSSDEEPVKPSVSSRYSSNDFKRRSPAKPWSDTEARIQSIASPRTAKDEKYKLKYSKLHDLHEDSLKKIKEQQYTIMKLSNELKETKESTENHRMMLERLKNKIASYDSSFSNAAKEANSELQAENKRLITEMTKLKIDLDRAKGTDDLLSHYRLALMKLKAQNTAIKDKLTEYTTDKQSNRQEVELLQRALQDAEARNQNLNMQLQEANEARRSEARNAEHQRKQLMNEITELREGKIFEDQNEILRLKAQVAHLEEKDRQQQQMVHDLQGAIGQQREDYSHHLQAALELATAENGGEKSEKLANQFGDVDMFPNNSQSKHYKKRREYDEVTTPMNSNVDPNSGSRRRNSSRGRKETYDHGYYSPSVNFTDSSFRAEGALSRTTITDDLKNISYEIEELTKSLENMKKPVRD
eukprot:TRINITY_DN11747_c0_g1_i1.p1 TRINITY_DN11747_c0_g1~~TRINITY_DN11747_c0_g1_i1.p1  ORF type:complete len:499 (-),score=206.60 TRINITY_DN11747_c0_g1_i1:3-1499(-)